ncbi:P protein [Anoplophora glabripennis]|uniref:P protein n=1 Tax=Anoplophora glabripennis TaxID=217634 RepID=UPI000874BA27|nr:P protein [Anoplophora glabripennis]
MANNETVQDMHQISIPRDSISSYIIFKKPQNSKLKVVLEGALLPPYYSNLSTDWLSVWVQLMVIKQKPLNPSSIKSSDVVLLQNVSETWDVPVVSEKLIGHVPEVQHRNIFHLTSTKVDNVSFNLLRVQFRTNLKANFPVSMGYNLQPINPDDGIVYAALVLLGLYVLIIFELTHRTLAAMLASTMSVAILAALNERPTMEEIVSWIDIETLLLLFSMMTLVTIFGQTGIFDHTAVYAYKLTGGKMWPLTNILCILTALFSCFLDNVTTALLITPVTIKLCEVMKLNPRQILMYTLIFANIGGAITPIGDPPNVIIANNPAVIKSGINFGIFTLHMGLGVLIALTVVYIQLRITYRDMVYYKFDEPPVVQGLKREIAVWERTAASVGSYSKDEDVVKESLIKKMTRLQDKLKHTVNKNINAVEEDYKANVVDLEKQYPIKDKGLLIKSGITLALVICVFFLHSIPMMSRLGLGWTALLGVLLLLLLYDNHDLEGIFARVEWSTLLFFASLFILMEALARLGLIVWIGKQTEYVVMSVAPESRLAAAIVLILWISAIASAFVDNLPLTTMMVRIAVDLSNNSDLHLPLQPLIWSLSFGACLGGEEKIFMYFGHKCQKNVKGNGSLFGSSSNIVCAGVAEQHGYRFTFMQFLKVGLPVMLSSLTVITIYLIICHVVLNWH